MDKNSSLERRYSFNASINPHPIAESTCLNLNGTSSSPPRHFQWGGTPISPKNRSSSSFCLSSSGASATSASNEGASTSNGNRSRNSATSPQRNSNKSKIDPRIYADVQSKGLASRIVKYHENGARLNRSMSVNNLYNKPGQFPVVHLKKTELPYKATNRGNVSMTRIAPPERSMFYGNTLSSLMRSNSIVGLHKTDEEISRENRPILHPPPTEGEMEPTRSVLDVLKEISRKRINNDDLDSNDMTKKYCNRETSGDFTDNTTAAAAATLASTTPANFYQHAHLQQQQQLTLPPHLIRNQLNQSYKRQREQHRQPSLSPTQQHNQKHIALTTPTARAPTAATANATTQQQQSSPEQIAKKRLCSYNNDITSSLSSSVYHANKRKFYAKRQAADASNSSSDNSARDQSCLEDYNNSQQHRTKMLRQQQPQPQSEPQPELRFKQLQQTLSCHTPITPIPPTPLNQSIVEHVEAQRTRSEPIYPSAAVPAAKTLNSTSTASATKPKLTLFNAIYCDAEDDADNGDAAAAGEEDKASETGDAAGINFVKPKKNSAISSARNPLIVRTQKCKLAQMLCGMRGEIYQGGHDDPDQDECRQRRRDQLDASAAKVKQTAIVSSVAFTATTTTTTTISATTTTLQQTALATLSTGSDGKSAPTANIIGINILKNNDTSAAATPLVAPTTAANVASAALPILGGFKFTPAAATTTAATVATLATTTTPSTVAAATTIVTPTKSSPLVGLKLTPQSALAAGATVASTAVSSSVASVTVATPAAQQTFSFGISTPPTTTASSTVPVLGGFSFSAIPKPATAPLPANRFAPSSPGLLLFGAPTNTPSTSAANATPTFGALSQGTTTTLTFGSTPVTPTSSPSATLTFGSVAAPATSAPQPPTFGAALAGAAAAKSFSFGMTAAENKPAVAATATPTFGMLPPPATAAATTTTSMFGIPASIATTATTTSIINKSLFGSAVASTTMSTPAAGGFSFGSTPNAAKPSAAAAPFSFGTPTQPPTTTAAAANAPANNTFGFGAAAATAPAALTNSGAFSFGATTTTSSNQPMQPTPAANTAIANSGSQQSAFSFGGATLAAPSTTSANTSASIFGNAINTNNNNNNATASTFSFGGAGNGAAAAVPQQQPSVFGSVAGSAAPAPATFTFGGAATNAQTTTAKPAAAGGFAFGGSTTPTTNTTAANVTQPSSTNLFGTSTNSATTNVVKPSFSFGGGATATAAPSNSTFGSLAATTNLSQNKTFGFGSAVTNNSNNTNNHNNNATPQSTNLFGATSAPAPNKPLMGGFSFGNAAAANSPSLQQPLQLSKPTAAAAPAPGGGAFSFGGTSTSTAAPNANNTAAAPFSFGSSLATTQPAAANKTFGFGGANSQQQQPSAPTPTSAFSFSGQASSAAAPAASNGNLFAPPPQMGANPGVDRPIRRATRRLQKS